MKQKLIGKGLPEQIRRPEVLDAVREALGVQRLPTEFEVEEPLRAVFAQPAPLYVGDLRRFEVSDTQTRNASGVSVHYIELALSSERASRILGSVIWVKDLTTDYVVDVKGAIELRIKKHPDPVLNANSPPSTTLGYLVALIGPEDARFNDPNIPYDSDLNTRAIQLPVLQFLEFPPLAVLRLRLTCEIYNSPGQTRVTWNVIWQEINA